jgi:hypothetical protein
MWVIVALDGQNRHTICGDENGKPWPTAEAASAALMGHYIPGFSMPYELVNVHTLTKELTR